MRKYILYTYPLVLLLALIIIIFTQSCTPPMMTALKNTQVTIHPNVFDIIPIVDKGGKAHKYNKPNLEVYDYEQVWCETHQKWERVSVTYEPTILSKLRKIEYIVEEKVNESSFKRESDGALILILIQ